MFFSREQSKSQHTPHIEKGDRIGYQLVLRVSEEIRRIIETNGDRIFMGFNSHRVFDRFYVKSCAKCHRFGQYHAKCTSKSCCDYCGGEDHASEQCDVHHDEKDQSKYKCVNCEAAGKPHEGHSSHWFKCPTYIEHQDKIKKGIPYYSKNSH